MRSDTIYALSSGAGKAGIAVVRISGNETRACLTRLCGALPEPRAATLAALRDPESGDVIDKGLVLFFPAPQSFSGEDMAELHVHGGRAVLDGLFGVLSGLDGCTAAEPGEFTRRAFENGKLDLTAAEGIADLIEAETDAQRRQALKQMGGALTGLYEDWRGRLIAAGAHVEATIDFSDEELPNDLATGAAATLEALLAEIKAHLDDDRRGERLRDGFAIAILGEPNAGKSSLLNQLARRDAAIVSEQAGTTRDVIEVHMDLHGYPALLADTAGVRDGRDTIEREGVRRSLERARDADFKLVVIDGSEWPALDEPVRELIDSRSLIVFNKSDLAGPPPPAQVSGRPVIPVSSLTGDGLGRLLAALETEIGDRYAPGENPAITRARHREALVACTTALERAVGGLQGSAAVELVAEDIRLAARELGRISGRVDVEDLLDVVFRDFCIGK